MRRSLPLARINYSLADDWSLDTKKVVEARDKFGPNDIIQIHSNRWLSVLLNTIKDPMIWFLIGAAILFAVLKEYKQMWILLLATIPLIGMDAFLHWRTEASTRGLSSRLASFACVIRNGIKVRIPVIEIVPGDLVIISAGDFFPADGIIIRGTEVQVDESALTGESFPVGKKMLNELAFLHPDPIVDDCSWGFAGTALLTGNACLRVVYTGSETLYGEVITQAIKTVHSRTPLQKEVTRLVTILILVASVICIMLAAIRYLQGFGVIDAILAAAVLAVAALPDEFPVVFTFFLGLGVYRLAIKKALVRRAVSVENIGRVTCICSDKTGTITEGRFKLWKSIPSQISNSEELLCMAAMASRKTSGDPLDLAIFTELKKLNLDFTEANLRFPFTEKRKRESAIINYKNHKQLVATKGSPETILSIVDLPLEQKKYWREKIDEFASEGFKVIACAKHNECSIENRIEPEQHYHFLGLLIFSDPPRAGVKDAILQCKQSGIHVLMITGDHIETARSIAQQIGLGEGDPKVILAEEIQGQHLGISKNYFREIDVIARALPAQKFEIVKRLQAEDEIVAATGDGVNDVPALKQADVGIAMGERGTQSAREISDIILLDDNFKSIVDAISEGRQLFKNLKQSYKYLLMIHIPFVFSAALIPLFGYPILYFPIHIVMVELIIHPTSMLVFQDFPKNSNLEPIARNKKIRFFSNKEWFSILVIGVYTTLVVLFGYVLIFQDNVSTEYLRSYAIANIGFFSAGITIGLNGFRSLVTRVITSLTVLFIVMLIQIPTFSSLLSLEPLKPEAWAAVVGSAIITWLLVRI